MVLADEMVISGRSPFVFSKFVNISINDGEFRQRYNLRDDGVRIKLQREINIRQIRILFSDERDNGGLFIVFFVLRDDLQNPPAYIEQIVERNEIRLAFLDGFEEGGVEEDNQILLVNMPNDTKSKRATLIINNREVEERQRINRKGFFEFVIDNEIDIRQINVRFNTYKDDGKEVIFTILNGENTTTFEGDIRGSTISLILE